MQRSVRLAATLALVALGVACSDSTSPRSFVGVYSLVQVNGTTPPLVVFDNGFDREEVLGGTIMLNSDATFSDETVYRDTDLRTGAFQTFSDVVVGTYTTSGNTVTLTPNGDTPYSLSLSGNTLTQTAGNFTFQYNRTN